MLKSHNGWKASKDAAELNIISVPIEGTKIKVRCAKAVAPLIAEFCKEFNRISKKYKKRSKEILGLDKKFNFFDRDLIF